MCLAKEQSHHQGLWLNASKSESCPSTKLPHYWRALSCTQPKKTDDCVIIVFPRPSTVGTSGPDLDQKTRSWENSQRGTLSYNPSCDMFIWNLLVNHPVNLGLGLGLGWECRRVTPHYSVLKVNPQPKRIVKAKINWDKNELMMKDFLSKYLDVHMWDLGKGCRWESFEISESMWWFPPRDKQVKNKTQRNSLAKECKVLFPKRDPTSKECSGEL